MIENSPISIFSKVTNVKVKFRKKVLSYSSTSRKKGMDKESFVKLISLLEESETASDTLLETGIDLTNYESRFFEMFEILLESIFNHQQILYLQGYLYGKENIRNVPIVLDETGVVMEPETPEELWVAINKL